MQLSLSSIKAPKISKGADQEDEPFAYKSREFLRKLVIGKEVEYNIEYKVEQIGRTFGAIYVNEESIVKKVVCNGWAEVREDRGDKSQRSEDYEELVDLYHYAKTNKLGIFDKPSRGARKVMWSVPDPVQFYKQYKGIPQYGIVEYVRDGSSFKVYLPLHSAQISLSLTGVICPSTSKRNEDGENYAEPYSLDAKCFSELRILNRDILVYIEGVDKNGNFFGTFDHPCGNLSEGLLKAGLAQISEWSIQYTSAANIAAFRTAVNYAKNNKIRLWENYVAPIIVGDVDFSGTVFEITGSDCFIILPGGSMDVPSRKVYLSSIKAPKVIADKTDPFYYEAKELIRSKAIGKNVNIHIDYTRKVTINQVEQERYYATITTDNNINFAKELCQKGYATVIHHRADEERSICYDELVAAEDEAKKAQRGSFSKKPPPNHLINDMFGDSQKSKNFLSFLQGKKLKAIVEYCFNASHFKIHIPKENCSISFSLSAIKTPSPPKTVKGKEIEGEPCGLEALDFTKYNINQRDVDIEIVGIDRIGNFLGTLAYKSANNRNENLTYALLRKGYASTIDFVVNRLADRDTLFSIEKTAQDNHYGIWKNYKPSVSNTVQNTTTVIRGTVTEIYDGKHFFFLPEVNHLPEIEKMMENFGNVVGNHPCNDVMLKIKRNARCLALYNDDGYRWYRAVIVDFNQHEETATVKYTDYGNTDTIPFTHLRPGESNTFKYPPQVIECELEGVLCPSIDNESMGIECAEHLSSLIFNQLVTIKILHTESDINYVIVYTQDGRLINQQVIRKGYGRYHKKVEEYYPSESDIWKALEESHIQAANERINIFRNGDLGFIDYDQDEDE